VTLPRQVQFASAAVKQARYDPEQAVLDLWYAAGDRYSYFDVPAAVYGELLAIEAAGQSVGEFVNRRIKPSYRTALEPSRRRFRPSDQS
jgi:hypothetical protein